MGDLLEMWNEEIDIDIKQEPDENKQGKHKCLLLCFVKTLFV